MRSLTRSPKFSLTYLLLDKPLSSDDLPKELDSFIYDEESGQNLTIAFRCDDDHFFKKILVLHYPYSKNLPGKLENYSNFGIFCMTGGVEIIATFMLSNLILDRYDPDYRNESKWVRIDGQPLTQKDHDYFEEISSSLESIALGFENCVDKGLYAEKKFNNLSYAVDFRNLIPTRKDYPSDDYEHPFPITGPTRFQYNINQDKLRWRLEKYKVPDFIYNILTDDQKDLLSRDLLDHIKNSWEDILRNVFNQKFQVENNQVNQTEERVSHHGRSFDPWGSSMYSVLGGDGEENIYLSEGISIRPDGSLTDD